LRLRRHAKHYDKHARKASSRFCVSANEKKQKGGAYVPPANNTLRVKVRLRCYKLLCKLYYLRQKMMIPLAF
jgi:hypothetical protein